MKILVGLTLFGPLGLAGCASALDEDTTGSIEQYSIDTTVQRPGEDELLAIAYEVESFAGYYCANGNLVVAVTSAEIGGDREKLSGIVSDLGILAACYNRPHWT